MRVPLGWDNSASLIIDALVGTGLTHPPRADALAAITQMIQSGKPILAIDVPSGLDCDTGLPLGEACIRATKTITFVAEKAGFANLVLAGDWVHTDHPTALMERAVATGRHAANSILASDGLREVPVPAAKKKGPGLLPRF